MDHHASSRSATALMDSGERSRNWEKRYRNWRKSENENGGETPFFIFLFSLNKGSYSHCLWIVSIKSAKEELWNPPGKIIEGELITRKETCGGKKERKKIKTGWTTKNATKHVMQNISGNKWLKMRKHTKIKAMKWWCGQSCRYVGESMALGKTNRALHVHVCIEIVFFFFTECLGPIYTSAHNAWVSQNSEY